MLRALRSHWPEHLIEGALLGLFMVSASVFTIALMFSPWGKRSGAQRANSARGPARKNIPAAV